MSFDEFKQKLEQEIKRHFPGEVEVNFKKVEIGSDIFCEGVELNDGKKEIVPVFDADELYETVRLDENSISSVAMDLVNQYGLLEGVSEEEFQSMFRLEEAEQFICLRIMNYDKNQSILQDMPHRKWQDLAVVLYVCKDLQDGCLTMPVTNGQVIQWAADENDLFKKAEENTWNHYPVQIKKIGDEEAGQLPVYILSNDKLQYGAVGMLHMTALAEFADAAADDLYLVPSSVHECLIVPVSGHEGTIEDLRSRIAHTSAAEYERLSESIYIYRRKSSSVEVVLHV